MTPEQEKRFDEKFPQFLGYADVFNTKFESDPKNRKKVKDFISSLLKEERERVREEYKEYLQYHYEHFGIESVKALLALTPDTNQTDLQ